jgi:hypothetical protein
MRLSARVSVGVMALVLSAAPVFAQEYVEYKSVKDGFMATFPVEPKVTETTTKSQFDAMLPTRT